MDGQDTRTPQGGTRSTRRAGTAGLLLVVRLLPIGVLDIPDVIR